MSNYQPQSPSVQPQMQPTMIPNIGQGVQNPGQQVYGPNPYQVMDNPAAYAQYNQGQIPNMQVGQNQPVQEGFLDKMIKGIVNFIAKLAGQPDPKTGTGGTKPVGAVPNQQIQMQQGYQQVPMQQTSQAQGFVGKFFQGVQNVAQNVGDMGQQAFQGIQTGVQQVAQAPAQVQQNVQVPVTPQTTPQVAQTPAVNTVTNIQVEPTQPAPAVQPTTGTPQVTAPSF